MNTNHRTACTISAISVILAYTSATPAAPAATESSVVPLEASTLIIEFNASDRDIGVQFFIDSEGWRSVQVFDPKGSEILSADTAGRLARQGGGSEFFLESVEPELEELSLSQFFTRFPAGTYRFRAVDNEGVVQVGRAQFSHALPAGPVLTSPPGSALPAADCANLVAEPVTIAWKPVKTAIGGAPIEVVKYEVIVENDELNFDAKFPAKPSPALTIPAGLLRPNTRYSFEVLAVAKNGNQTITEGCFTTPR